MTGILQALADDAPLYGEVPTAIYRHTFIDTPADRTMVNDDVMVVHRAESVTFMVFDISVAQTEAHETHYDIVTDNGNGIVGNTDSVTGCRLSEESLIRPDGNTTFKEYGTRDVEDDDSWLVRLHSLTEGALATIIGK